MTGHHLVINDEGVHRYHGTSVFEQARWDDIVTIGIITNDEGPFFEDFFWMLSVRGGGGCCVPGDLAQTYHLLPALQERYGEAFDNEQVIAASGCTDNEFFLVWRAEPEPAAMTASA